MFMIHTPQTIQLYGMKPAPQDGKPDESAPSMGSITFQHETDDVSKCQMIVRIEDRVYTYTFGTRGPIVETAYEDDETRKAAAEELKKKQAEEALRAEENRADKLDNVPPRHPDGDLKTMDDTTDKDVSWDAPHDPVAPPPPFHNAQPEHNPFAQAPVAGNRMMEDHHG
jgi:hypothetical protein